MQRNSNSRALFVTDLIAIYTFFFIIFTYYRGASSIPIKGILLVGLIGFLWFLISISFNICKVNRRSNLIEVLKSVLVSYSVLSTTVIAIVGICGEFRPNDKLVLFPLFFAFIFSALLRSFYLVVIKLFIKNGYQQKSALLIGGGRLAKKVIDHIISSPELGFRLHGALSDNYHELLPKRFYLGKLDGFSEIIRTNQIDEVIIAIPLNKEKVITQMVKKCEMQGVRFHIVLDFYHIFSNRAVVDSLGDIPLIGIRPEPLNIFSNRMIKRAFDILIALTTLILLSPFFLLFTILVKISSPGPVFFKQKRVGANNSEFEIYKFRSMIVQDRKDSDSIWTNTDDNRITRIGRYMRKTNLDELPQIWNVLLGNMSIVGPRPERKHFIEKFKNDIPYYNVRHLVKSGITGWAQANGWRGDTSIAKRVEHDIYYLENWSLWMDLKILFLTLFNRKAWKNAI